MLDRLTPKTWLAIAAVVVVVAAIVVVIALTVGDGDGDDVATGTTTSAPATDTSTGPTTIGGDNSTGERSGTTASAPAPCTDPPVSGKIVGRHDLDGDGVDELFVKTGAGAATDIIGLFRVDGCRAVHVTTGGSPAEFAAGATVRNISGLQVHGDSLLVYSGTSADAQVWDVTWVTLRYQGGTLTKVGSDSGTAQVDDDLYTAASTFGS